MAGVGSFRFAFGHFDAANASGIVHPEVDRAVVTKPPQETSTKADRMRVVAYVSPVPDGTELAKANDVAVELLARISPAIITPDIVSRHWQESVPPAVRQTRIQKAKRKQAKNEPLTSKPPLALDPKACQLEEFDAFRWAFSLPTGCHL